MYEFFCYIFIDKICLNIAFAVELCFKFIKHVNANITRGSVRFFLHLASKLAAHLINLHFAFVLRLPVSICIFYTGRHGHEYGSRLIHIL
jgi:hypothetical protein